jgi:hypothetical protein
LARRYFLRARPKGAGIGPHHAFAPGWTTASPLTVDQEGAAMFGFRKKTAPPLCKSNPGIGVEGKVAFATGDRSWTEEFNTVTLAASALQGRGFAVRAEKTWLVHEDSGFILLPQLVQLQPLEDGGVRTVSTIQTNHPGLATPDGLFEYQHSTGESAADSIRKGFDQWAQVDFPVLIDALLPKPQACTMLEMAFPAKDGAPARVRRAVLGPVLHYMALPSANDEGCSRTADALGQEDAGDAHPFCPCCLLTKSFEAFRELIMGDGFYGLRLYAMRDAEGTPQADCRVNGDDWEKGAQALREYVKTWPDAGFEFRKQYVVLHSVAKKSSPA